MSVPKQIQQAADQVAAIEQALAAEQAPPPAPPPADVIELGPVEPPLEPPPPPAEPPPAPPPPAPPPENWEHKYKTLQGLFNSQMRDLQTQLRAATDEIKDLKKAKPAEPPKKPAADPKDVEEFGADMVSMVERVTERMFGAIAHDLTTRLAQLETQVSTASKSVAQTAEQAFWSELERRVPDWKDINEDERFLAWLAVEDPLFGAPRQAALDRAQQTLNPAAAANVFAQFRASVAPPAPPPAAPPPKPSVENQVAPTTRASAPPPATPPAAPMITQRQIEVFYNELAQGKYRGREQVAAQIEAQINQALVEGRVR